MHKELTGGTDADSQQQKRIDDLFQLVFKQREEAAASLIGLVVSHYRIVRKLGGGMGVLYEARDFRWPASADHQACATRPSTATPR